MITAKIADHTFRIISRSATIERLFNAYTCDDPPEHTIVSPDLPDFQQTSLAIQREMTHWLHLHDTVLMHGVLMDFQNHGIIFTAPSGTGKSTHTLLWKERFGDSVRILNGDKPFLSFNSDEAVIGYASPWSGKENLHTPGSVELKAIVILHQAPVNTIKQLSPEQALPQLFEQLYCRPGYAAEDVAINLRRAERLALLPVFSLGCTISREAVELAHNAIFNVI